MKLLDGVKGDATFSPDHSYRYLLTREWDWSLPPVVWVMLNPSTAGTASDDQTLRRVQAYSRAWGRGRCYVVNLFGLRSTSPKALYAADDPVGPGNDDVLDALLCPPPLETEVLAVAAWGAHGARVGDRVRVVMNIAARYGTTLHRLGPSLKGGHPRHPCRAVDGLPLEVHW